MEIWSIAMNDVPEGYLYPEEVRFELDDKNLSQYQLAAEFLNMNQVDAVCLQHEYGIFGGNNGSHILEFISNLRMPVVTTLHTVLRKPTQGQKAILEEIGYISERIAVMSQRAETIIREVYAIPKEKITLIHHGIPDVPFVDPNYFKDQFGVEGRKVILTFGLVSPGKGIEHMIEALPEIVKRHPDTVYIVLGETHPHILREEGEEYRFGLQFLAKEKGVEDNIIFHNRFVELKELCEFLGASDIYVTPYLDKDQIVSGTLAYALGTGNAAVSTPYWYAEEMLAEGRGRIVPFQDPEALAGQVINLLDDEVERHAIRKRAYTYTRDMIWDDGSMTLR
jgi:glycosyltransferase involved in cell wall biosynthesis